MKATKFAGVLSIIAGIIMVLAGIGTYATVSAQLSAEDIVVPGDAAFLAGRQVRGPFTAFAQADIINHHALEGSDGKTYAELGALATEAKKAGDQELADKYTQQRQTVMTASFLRASLFTSVVAFGVAALVVGLGVLFMIVGWGLTSIARLHPQGVTDAA